MVNTRRKFYDLEESFSSPKLIKNHQFFEFTSNNSVKLLTFLYKILNSAC